MIPDSVQAYEVYSGRRDEAFLYSISLLFSKMGQAVGLSVSSFILGLVGYDPTTETQSDLVQNAIRILTFIFPALIILFGAVLIMFTSDFSKLQIVPVPAVPQTTLPPGSSEDEKESALRDNISDDDDAVADVYLKKEVVM